MQNKELQAGTTDEQRTAADSIPSASLAQNGMLSDAVSIEEGNRIIDKFLNQNVGNGTLKLRELKYHSSWDWLKPVIDKINNIPDDTFNGDSLKTVQFSYEKRNVTGMRVVVNIEDAFAYVVEFIKWYNDNTAEVGIR